MLQRRLNKNSSSSIFFFPSLSSSLRFNCSATTTTITNSSYLVSACRSNYSSSSSLFRRHSCYNHLVNNTLNLSTLFAAQHLTSIRAMSELNEKEVAELKAQVDAQADKVKNLKAAKTAAGVKPNDDAEVKAEVAKLVALKSKMPAAAPAPAAAAAAGGEEAPKVDKKAERSAARVAEEEARRKAKADTAASMRHLFGERNIQSLTYNSKEYTTIGQLSLADAGKTKVIRARIHNSRKQSAKLTFLVLRQTYDSVQAVLLAGTDIDATEKVPLEMVAYASALPCESIVEVEAIVRVAEPAITSTSQQHIELHVTRIHCIAESLPVLPFPFEDAKRSAANNDNNLPTINVDTRLLCRWMDMRTPASNSIFRLQSRVGQFFRQFLLDNDFVEIHSPKMIGMASEGGAGVFELNYMGRKGYLAQSPQLYKEMALQGDLERVFEVGPVFRAENSNTHRHLTEFTGLDLEMRIYEHYFEVLDVAEGLFNYMFERLAQQTQQLAAINEQYPFEPFVWKMTPEKMKELGIGIIDGGNMRAQQMQQQQQEQGGAAAASSSSPAPSATSPTGLEVLGVPTTDPYYGRVKNENSRMLRMPFTCAVSLLNTELEEGKQLGPTDDINTANEKLLGRIIKKRYGVDFYIVDRFPLGLRPFYTMPCHDDPRFSNSYDFFMRGEEITSGAQRVHSPTMMEERAKGLNVDLKQLKDYIDSARLGGWPHGGFGVGLERVVMLYLGIGNIRYCSMFPRDPQRLTP